MSAHEQLSKLLESEPAVPRGWFRWLHNHYLGRYSEMYPGLAYDSTSGKLWEGITDEPEPIYQRIAAPDVWPILLNRHAWMAGMIPLEQTVIAHWDKLEMDARGAFIAGLSEHYASDNVFEIAEKRLPEISFSPESLCQLACNAVKYQKNYLLDKLMQFDTLLQSTVSRFDANENTFGYSEQLDSLSHRVIDMILEAALIQNNAVAARIALEHGADPNIPVWQLERSSNHKFSALGYVIDSEFSQDMKSHKELAELLLDHGASASGTSYSGYGHELFLAIGRGWHDLAKRLIIQGAKLSKQIEPQKSACVVRTGGSETLVVGPGGPSFYGHFSDKLKWAHENIGSIIPLVPVSEKQSFFSSNAQGGSKSTIMDKVVGSLEHLKRYESLGLDTRLTAEELCTAVDCGAFDSLVYLLSKYGDTARDRAMFRIRRFKHDIGASWRHMDILPQADGVNIATDFDPQGQSPFELPDGSRLYVDLSAIAAPGHNLGPCFEGYFWLRTDNAVLRRRRDKVIVRRLEKKWKMEPLPLRPPGICRGQRYLDDCLPCIREINGRFIHLGLTLHRVRQQLTSGRALATVQTPWKDLPAYVSILDQAEQLISEQVNLNSTPEEPALNQVELHGYPPHFWPYLVRLADGFVSMTITSCLGNDGLLKEYNAWARKAKACERSFIPDPRLLAWEHWHEIPPEYKPYFHYDTMFKRVSVVSGGMTNEYYMEMAKKVSNWYYDMQQVWRNQLKSK